MRRKRQFRPGNLAVSLLETRCVPAYFMGLIPQSYNSLTDSNGVQYAIDDGNQLVTALGHIHDTGAKITNLTIKGHGADGLILLTDQDGANADQLTDLGGGLTIIAGGVAKDITKLLPSIVDGNTTIMLAGCSTGDLGQNISSTVGGGATVTSSPVFPAIGIPFTGLTVGFYQDYVNGSAVTTTTGFSGK